MENLASLIRAIADVLCVTPLSSDTKSHYFSGESLSKAWIGFYRRDRSAVRHLWGLDENDYPGDPSQMDALRLCDRIILIDTDDIGVLETDKLDAHLSALDWALCFVVAMSSIASARRLPSIGVLDLRKRLRSGKREKWSDLARDMGIKHFLPEQDEIRAFDSFSEWLQEADGGKTSRPNGRGTQHASRWWISDLAIADSREGHHYLNNSIGPLALASNYSKQIQRAVADCSPGERRARSAMIRALEWMAGPQEGREKFCMDWAELYRSAKYEPERELRILLLDDQAAEGWVPVLAATLDLISPVVDDPRGVAGGFRKEASRAGSPSMPAVSLWVGTDPEAALRTVLEMKSGSKGMPAPLRFTRIGASDDQSFDEILLLDLRLFSKKASEAISNSLQIGGAERRFLEEIRDALLATGEEGNHEMPGGTDGYPQYLKSLTWLSRLIAKIDYTYPIILWSSTGQRKVTEALKDLPSVYTRLEKPRFGSYGIEGIEFALVEAVTDRIHLLAAADFVRTSRHAQLVDRPHARVDIYADESGKDASLKLGGLAVLYQADSPEELAQTTASFRALIKPNTCSISIEREGTTVAIPFQWGPTESESGEAHINPSWLRKVDVQTGREASSNAKAIYRCLHNAAMQSTPGKVSLVFFKATAPYPQENSFKLEALDGRYYSAMPYVLEALVAHVFAPDTSGSKIAYRIRTPQRSRPLKTAQNLALYREDWGDETFPIKDEEVAGYQSVSDQWIHATAWMLAERNRLPAKCIHGASAPDINKVVAPGSLARQRKIEETLRFCADPVPRYTPHDLDNVLVGDIDHSFRAVLDAAANRFDDLGGALEGAERAYARGGGVHTTGKQRPLVDEAIASLCRYARRELDPTSFSRYVALRRSSVDQCPASQAESGSSESSYVAESSVALGTSLDQLEDGRARVDRNVSKGLDDALAVEIDPIPWTSADAPMREGSVLGTFVELNHKRSGWILVEVEGEKRKYCVNVPQFNAGLIGSKVELRPSSEPFGSYKKGILVSVRKKT